MWAAGRWGAARPPSDAWFPADCSARSRPSSGSVSAPTADARGQGLEAVAVRSPSPRLSCSNSTRSLLSPLCRQSFAFDDDGDAADEEEVDEDAHDSEAEGASPGGVELQGRARVVESKDNQEEQKQVCLPESSLTPWEVWFVGKEKEERGRLQQKALEELTQQLEKRKEKEEREKRKIIAEEKHKEWVQKKNEQEKEKQRQAELQEKKEIAERKFKEWLENSKNKPRPAAKSYGYANGKLTGFYNGNSYPEPAFYNPIPWKPIHVPPPKEAKDLSGKKTKRPVISQPQRSSSLVIHKARNNLCLGTLCRIQR
ncbi:coiled-coil domain-containing protein 34 isoform X2 [Myotis yumanensis]|uniref:coiled-coil domain-containing protein 34 isoform X2 n=1 Tax=Myotis yumanensis TaxID=159337 RepID=UPI0038D4FCB5